MENLLNEIQQALKVPKDIENKFGGFNYRTCGKILEEVKPLLGATGTLILNDEIVQLGDRYYIKATATLSDGTKEWSATACAREALDKTKFDVSQLTGSASSYARKLALGGLLAIDDTRDADSHENLPTVQIEPTKAPVGKITPPKVVTTLKQKDEIKKLCDKIIKKMIDGGDAEAFPLETKEEYNLFVKNATGLVLEEGNFDTIIERLKTI